MSTNTTFSEIFPIVATIQGQISYSLFSIYAVNPGVFYYYLGADVGPFLFTNMIFGNAVHIYSRPAMKKLRTSYRILYSIYGTYMFNFSSLMLFFILGDNFKEKPLFASILSYIVGKFMYSMFYSYLYFVDKCAFPDSRQGSDYLDVILDSNHN